MTADDFTVISRAELAAMRAVIDLVREEHRPECNHYHPLLQCLTGLGTVGQCLRERTHTCHCDEHAVPTEDERADAPLVRALDALQDAELASNDTFHRNEER